MHTQQQKTNNMKHLLLLLGLGLAITSCSKDELPSENIATNKIETFAGANNGTKWQSTTYEDNYDGIEADTQLTIAIGGGNIFTSECKSGYSSNFLDDADEITINTSNKIEFTYSHYNEYDKYQEDVTGSLTKINGQIIGYYESYENGVLAQWAKVTYKKVNEFDCN